MKKLSIAVTSAVLASGVVANEAKTINEEIITTANKLAIPLAETLPTTSVITASDIERAQAVDLGTLLNRVSGVSFRDSGGRGSSGGVFVRGASTSQTIVLIDGVRSSSATTGATAIENIPVSAIERIEIVKGPLSGLYGADAVGGVIQVFTKKGGDAGLSGNLKVTAGTHNAQLYSTSISGGNDKHSFRATFSKEDTRGIDRTSLEANGNGDRDSFEETSANLGASFTLLDNLTAQVNYLKTDGRSEFDNVFGQDEGRFSDSELESLSGKLVFDATDNVSFSLDLGYFSDHLITPAFSSDIQTRRRSAGLQSNFRVNESNTFTLGVDYYQDDVTTLAAFPETERDNIGYFTQWQTSLGDLSAVASLRYDDNDTYDNDVNGSLAVGYQLTEQLELVASYGTAFQAPSFNSLFFPNFGNPDVLPEESDTTELSLRGDHGGYQWRASVYRTNVDNLIAFDLATFLAGNVAEATLEGVEFEISKSFAEWSFTASIDYLEARDEDTNEFLDDRATVSGNIQVGRQFDKLYLGLDVLAEHGRHDRGGQDLGGFSIWGLSAVYDVTERLTLSGRVDNLFNKNYTTNLATDTINFENEGTVAKLTVQYSFQ